MKVLFVTGSLNQGGAEYQLIALANLFAKAGYTVKVLAITDYDFYLPLVKESDLDYQCLSNDTSKMRRLFLAAHLIRRFRPDVIVSYLRVVSMFALFAKWLSLSGAKLVVGERTGLIRPEYDKFYFNLMRFSFGLTVNSYAKAQYVAQKFPFLRRKLMFIPNVLPSQGGAEKDIATLEQGPIVYVGRISPEKNVVGLIKAFKKAAPHLDERIELHIYGDAADRLYYASVLNEVDGFWRIKVNGRTRKVGEVYAGASLLCLVSSFEGFSNVLAEAMASGVPVLVSNIVENTYLVKEGVNGIVVDASKDDCIAKGIVSYFRMSLADRVRISRQNCVKVSQMLDNASIIARYRDLLGRA